MPRVNFNLIAATPLPSEIIREAIAGQYCPWCNRRGFKNLAYHVGKAHGLNRHGLKEMAKIHDSEPCCSLDFSQKRKQSALKNWVPGRCKYRMGKKKTLNTAARQSQQSRILSVSPDIRRKNARKAGLSVTVSGRERQKIKTSIALTGRRRAPEKHGTLTQYTYYGCRCGECTRTYREYQTSWKRKKRLSSTLVPLTQN